jgi:hypothetical protein
MGARVTLGELQSLAGPGRAHHQVAIADEDAWTSVRTSASSSTTKVSTVTGASSTRGNETVKVLPAPGSVSTSTLPSL